jgi:hypothetical protein
MFAVSSSPEGDPTDRLTGNWPEPSTSSLLRGMHKTGNRATAIPNVHFGLLVACDRNEQNQRMKSCLFSHSTKALGSSPPLAQQDDHTRIVEDATSSMERAKQHYNPAGSLHRPLVLALLAALGLIGLVIAVSPDLLP